ncbi:M23 family metallopeptidase [Erythrobacter sp. JK5]|uniref:M23 family metallopeptidase n=1 Tax=Erythrobacter sp. JK5 TaxID=2829500 RepID=UPI001BA5BFB4|nr:M23 family metallopeptidase [Erythrobacter sp. JK5]QUL38869.1 M23 family metallopeptidase [Erythrobacter sp. JK5]
MSFFDRLLTIVVTATLTSAIWIVAGGSLIELASQQEGEDSLRPAEAAPSPLVSESAVPEGQAAPTAAPPLDPTPSPSPTEDTIALRIPVLNVRASDLSDTFLETSEEEGGRPHEAIDIMAPKGTSVVAAAPGTIAKLHRSASGGNSIYIRSPDKKTIHFYAHLDEYAEGLREGQRVRRGQRLGTVGSTGNASAESPHLHFAILRTTADAEWWEPANAVNPYPLLTAP